MTVIADTKSLKAELVTGNRVNYMCHGDRPIPYVAAKENGAIWLTLHNALKNRTYDLLLFMFNVNCCNVILICFLGYINYINFPELLAFSISSMFSYHLKKQAPITALVPRRV